MTECHAAGRRSEYVRYYLQRHGNPCDGISAQLAGNPLPFAHTPVGMKSHSQQQEWTLSLRLPPMPRFEPGSGRSASPFLESEHQEQIANSKLDRLADELRALGIEF